MGPDRDEYELFLGEFVTDERQLSRWRAIGEALGPRDGWQYGWRPPTDGFDWLVWVLGEDEPWKLVLSAAVDGELFLWDEMMLETRVRGTLERVLAWLDEHEHEYDGPCDSAPSPVDRFARSERPRTVVSFDRGRYELFCREWTGGYDLERWLLIGDALGSRPGWRYGIGGNPEWIEWTFGEVGASRLVLSASLGGGLVIYDSATDEEHRLGTLERALAWVEDHEDEYRGLTPLQYELRGFLDEEPL